ncbi:hypothetical protein TNCV_3127091 [Trichonephila clavipes]|nr:hypothetical protein TNCV_3127091 [Trichonephila clavipes]
MVNYSGCPKFPKPRKGTQEKTNTYTNTVNSIIRPGTSYSQAASSSTSTNMQQMAPHVKGAPAALAPLAFIIWDGGSLREPYAQRHSAIFQTFSLQFRSLRIYNSRTTFSQTSRNPSTNRRAPLTSTDSGSLRSRRYHPRDRSHYINTTTKQEAPSRNAGESSRSQVKKKDP